MMKTKDIKALHQLEMKELLKKQSELQLELAQARLKKKAGKLDNTSSVRVLADDLARVKTIINTKKD